jgi:hypothetical protein
MMTTSTSNICRFFLLLLFLSLVELSECKELHRRPLSLSHSSLQRHDDHRSLQSSSSSFSTAIATLTASNGGVRNYFGSYDQGAISNNRIVVGAWGNNGNQGATYVFGDPSNPKLGRSYSELFILTASDGASNQRFGETVAIDGDFIVVGATRANGKTSVTGAVYVYKISEDASPMDATS